MRRHLLRNTHSITSTTAWLRCPPGAVCCDDLRTVCPPFGPGAVDFVGARARSQLPRNEVLASGRLQNSEQPVFDSASMPAGVSSVKSWVPWQQPLRTPAQETVNVVMDEDVSQMRHQARWEQMQADAFGARSGHARTLAAVCRVNSRGCAMLSSTRWARWAIDRLLPGEVDGTICERVFLPRLAAAIFPPQGGEALKQSPQVAARE